MAEINNTLWELRELYRAEQNPGRRQKLQDNYDRALSAVLDMADKNIGKNTAAFDDAVTELDTAVTKLREAKRDLGNVVKAIGTVAKAIDGVVKIAVAVATV
jgi:hypothetical protein